MNAKKIDNKLPIAWEGIPFIILGIGFTALFFMLQWVAAAITLAILTVFTAYFFRDPERTPIDNKMAIFTPADGKVLSIEHLQNGDHRSKDKSIKISIFMSIFNAHINRVPIKGKIAHISYHPGRFFSANRDKASVYNEHNVVTLETDTRKEIIFVQIAGIIARRIACWVKQGDYVETAQRFGLIRFGSRLEVYLPTDCEIKVTKGEKVKAGKTIIGYLSETEKKKKIKKKE